MRTNEDKQGTVKLRVEACSMCMDVQKTSFSLRLTGYFLRLYLVILLNFTD